MIYKISNFQKGIQKNKAAIYHKEPLKKQSNNN